MAGPRASLLATFASALAGAVLGAVLATALRPEAGAPRATPGRGSAAIQEAIDRVAAATDTLAKAVLESLRQPHPAPATVTPIPAGAPQDDLGAASALAVERQRESERLRALVERPKDDDALRKLSLIPDHMMGSYALRTYEDILAEFGSPSSYGFRDGMLTFHYMFEDGEGRARSVSFLFYDGLVFRMDAR